ncbi:MAG: hypothetical protein QM621_04295 [Aeromicrobium sp.]|uniref:hypothetical protein n=1 Tax=Aeromicrobium sp. TaxID=1871063 RepID=UPI0039E411BC
MSEDQMTETTTTGVSAPAKSLDLRGQLTAACGDMFAYDVTRQPLIRKDRAAEAVTVGGAIGEKDGQAPGVDEHSPTKVMPSEDLILNSVQSAMHAMGAEVSMSIKRSREGEDLTQEPPQEEPSLGQKVLHFLRRHAFMLVALVAVAVFEYFVGIEWTQRIFEVDDTEAHILALVLPILFAVIGVVVAQGVMIAARGSVKKIIIVSVVLTLLGFFTAIICAGLVMSGQVEPSSNGGGGVTGGGVSGGAEGDDGDGAYSLVKLGSYVSLLFAVTVTLMLTHLIDLYRAWHADTEAAAEAARNALTPDEVVAADLAYLDQFRHLYAEMVEVRQDVIRAYISGVRSTLSNRIADDWNHQRLLDDQMDEPEWLAELAEEIDRLEAKHGVVS